MLSGRAEDYLEAIYNIHLNKGYIRVKDIAIALNVKYPTVSEMLKKLELQRLVSYEKYGGIMLTDKGTEIARSVKDRHDTLVRPLTLSGVPSDIASADACALEHHLSPRSIEQLKKLVVVIESDDISKLLKTRLKLG